MKDFEHVAIILWLSIIWQLIWLIFQELFLSIIEWQRAQKSMCPTLEFIAITWFLLSVLCHIMKWFMDVFVDPFLLTST